MPERFEPNALEAIPRTLRYIEARDYIDENLSQAEKMTLICDLMIAMDQDILIPCKGWMLTEQGGARDVLTINLAATSVGKHRPGTVSFVETDMPRSKLRRTLIPDMAPRQLYDDLGNGEARWDESDDQWERGAVNASCSKCGRIHKIKWGDGIDPCEGPMLPH